MSARARRARQSCLRRAPQARSVNVWSYGLRMEYTAIARAAYQPETMHSGRIPARIIGDRRSGRAFGTADAPGTAGPIVDSSPKKAGGGGSIPSLATMFSVVYRPSKTQFHSISFQNSWPLRFAFAGMRPVWSRFLGAGSLFRPALFLSVEGRNPHNHRHRCN